MLWREAMASTGAKADATAVTGGAAVGGIFTAFGDMTVPALIIFGLTVLLIAGRVALTWVRFCREYRHRHEPPPEQK